MRRILIALAMTLTLVSTASAQFATPFTWGPTVPMFKVSLQDSVEDGRTGFLDAGAGVFFGANLAPTQDGRWRMVTFSVPVFFNYTDGGFGLDAGFTLGTLNNLLSVGIGTGLVKDGAGVKEVFSRDNTYVLISASLNFGSGGMGTSEQSMKATASGPIHTRPPGYVGW